ncbi:DUF2971 domain-containing protein [Leifsonia shinshuensis]|uniref:DUF2971 domain-containing protein n=1 Tax=Leifsonia shinshuensis TaxID=150026 RepID=UPI001F50C281|nr:DUF2971 domain-containing protein [Leifsonia shinshuensis]MCI0155419.1 DUF2971 domain-containing protein [Leifsonia shinshuensis]
MTVLDLDLWDRGQPELIFHYTSAGAIAAILDSGILRFNSLERTNDPRETKEYQFAFTTQGRNMPEYVTADAMNEHNAKVNDIIQKNVFIACFTTDDVGLANADQPIGHGRRGFGRARNWHQYADQHRGAVLAFDRYILEAQLRELVSDSVAEKVFYSDIQRDIDEDGNQFTWQPEHLEDPEASARLILTEKRRQFFLTKYTDWASEREYRLLAFTQDRPELPIADSFAGIRARKGLSRR